MPNFILIAATRHLCNRKTQKIDQFRSVALKKINVTQQKQTAQEQNRKTQKC